MPPSAHAQGSRLALPLLLLLAGLTVLFPVADYDTFWHVANGREMISQGRIIHEEVFSYTSYGTPHPNHEWLSQILFYAFYRLAKADGLLLLKELLVLTMTGLLYSSARRQGLSPWLSLLLILGVVTAGLPRYLDRPQIFTLFNLSLLGWLLYAFRAGAIPPRALVAVPVLVAVWDVLHGAVFGLVFLAIFTGGEWIKPWLQRRFPAWEGAAPMSSERRKALLYCALATLLVWVVHPQGLRTFFFFMHLATGGTQTNLLQEFLPTAWSGNLPFWAFLWLSLLLLLANLGRHLDPLTLLLALPFGWLSVRYMREIPTFPIVMLPALAALAASSWQQWGTCSWQRWARHGAALGIAVALGAYLFQIKWQDRSPRNDLALGHGLNENLLPMASTRFIKAANLQGNLYNTGHYGGFISYFLTPERKIFHFHHPFLFRNYLNLLFDPSFPEKLEIQYALLGDPVEVRHTFAQPRWVPVYWEPAAMVVVRREGINREVAQRFQLHHFHPDLTMEEAQGLAGDPFVLSRLTRELADHLTHRQDPRLEAIQEHLAARLPEPLRATLLPLPRPLPQ